MIGALSEPRMLECLFRRRSFQGINLEKPAHEVQEMLVFTSQTLFQSRLLGNEDVDLEFFVISGRRFRLFLATALLFVVVASLLIDKSLASKEVRYKASFFHHVFGDWTDDANHT